ncbi:MAG: FAD-dependent 5-carboxymethylaminomethyl-2-thiouridine(34) oxidoreductase MnmC [Cardiobacteriaceae bacterium]|nr:FAD-dependent 5-carboxymethylaminomethyl-2-thiouridine(34) oxidoreductase MnmC [Cardiobacteriaceae bacterium]
MLLPYAQLSFRGQTPISTEYDDIYYNTQSGSAESDYVYLQGNGLPERFGAKKRFVVGEIGFGSGLNAFLTAKRFLEDAPRHHYLTYISIEHRPWRLEDLKRHHGAWDFLSSDNLSLLNAFYAQYPHNHRGFHLLKLHERVQFLLLWEEVESALQQLVAQVDAWYLDGFSPSKNPDCWQASVFQALSKNSATGASFASFSAARVVRDGLQAAGFAVEKRKGFGFKREMLHGFLEKPQPREEHWSMVSQSALNDEARIAVIGAGIAGASVARSLAESGREVVVYHDPECSPASHVPVAVPYVQPDTESALLCDYQVGSYHHALRFYHTAGRLHYRTLPLYQLPIHARQAKRYKLLSEQKLFHEPILQFNEAESALVYQQAGVIETPALVRDLLAHPRITVIPQKIHHYREEGQSVWIGQEVYGALVLATAWRKDLLQDEVLQSALRSVRGQGTVFKSDAYGGLAQIWSEHLTYIPMPEGIYVGASFTPKSEDLRENEEENKAYQSALQAYGQKMNLEASPRYQSAFVGIRAATTDYQPLVGALAQVEDLVEKYSKLRHDVNAVKGQNVALRRIYLHMGLGSKGLTQAWLNADFITAQINGTPLPVPKRWLALLSPNRYFIRALSRRQM